ncbi:glutathione S-transferase family protein [Rhodobium gokarnense]|uniref:Glutathione S-transferase n=1 Tax=Rhodobium gokarnense TaxID=364296 RepID=A0ABT3HB87_9HYPH|nr:glutathione S-transferase family protein [Rhodobium gokarnense]MCW2307624.1 glutathione S-transferase [Rhodobium gokarnense]
MKLYVDRSGAPNPRRALMFLAEKGIDVPLERVDLGKAEHLSEEFAGINPLKRLPVLVLDDGTAISESVAISRYFEEIHPEPPLFGTGAKDRALVEMWNRRIDLNLGTAVMAVFRHTHPAMAAFEVPQVPQWAEANRPRLLDFLRLLDGELAGRAFVAGDGFSIADISAYCYVEYLRPARMAVPEDCTYLLDWKARIGARPSAVATGRATGAKT